MADPVGKVVLDVIQKDCPSLTCSYRKGDGDAVRKKLKDLIEKKLEYRVSDGDKVRALEKRVKELEVALDKMYEKVSVGERLSPKDLVYLRDVIKPKKEKK